MTTPATAGTLPAKKSTAVGPRDSETAHDRIWSVLRKLDSDLRPAVIESIAARVKLSAASVKRVEDPQTSLLDDVA